MHSDVVDKVVVFDNQYVAHSPKRLLRLFQAKLNDRCLIIPSIDNLALKIKVAASFSAVVGLKKVNKIRMFTIRYYV